MIDAIKDITAAIAKIDQHRRDTGDESHALSKARMFAADALAEVRRVGDLCRDKDTTITRLRELLGEACDLADDIGVPSIECTECQGLGLVDSERCDGCLGEGRRSILKLRTEHIRHEGGIAIREESKR